MITSMFRNGWLVMILITGIMAELCARSGDLWQVWLALGSIFGVAFAFSGKVKNDKL